MLLSSPLILTIRLFHGAIEEPPIALLAIPIILPQIKNTSRIEKEAPTNLPNVVTTAYKNVLFDKQNLQSKRIIPHSAYNLQNLVLMARVSLDLAMPCV